MEDRSVKEPFQKGGIKKTGISSGLLSAKEFNTE
jgi:hypothetical protein